MSGNANGKWGMNGRPCFPNEMELFDLLPRWARDIINSAEYRISVIGWIQDGFNLHSPDAVREGIQRGVKLSAEAEYGPDHPQAQ